jgi:hypothetical protein
MTIEDRVKNRQVTLDIGEVAGFVTIKLARSFPRRQAGFVSVAAPKKCETGVIAKFAVTLRNTGARSCSWEAEKIGLNVENAAAVPLACDVEPGELYVFEVDFLADALPGLQSVRLRMFDSFGEFGPEAYAHITVEDSLCPAKLAAHSGVGGIYVQWFSPTGIKKPECYELFRAKEYGGEYAPLCSTGELCWRDADIDEDVAYYYQVRAIYEDGRASNFSNADNAKKRSKPRFYDAEIVDFKAPKILPPGKKGEIYVKFKNTGTKTWSADGDVKSVALAATRYFGEDDENKLPLYPMAETAPGETVELSFPIFAPREGRFENHWVVRMDVKIDPKKNRGMETRPVYIGTPLLCETDSGG